VFSTIRTVFAPQTCAGRPGRLMNNRYVNCSITLTGFETPPDHIVFQIESILDFSSPVIMWFLSLSGAAVGASGAGWI
jgi:hypothetical protein